MMDRKNIKLILFVLSISMFLSSAAFAETLKKSGRVTEVWPEYRQVSIDGVKYTVSPKVDFVNEDFADGVQGLKELAEIKGEKVIFRIHQEKDISYITSILVTD
jgi:hypothetical protein